MATKHFLTNVEELDNIFAFIEAEMEPLSATTKFHRRIEIVVDELFNNISSYAYGEDVGDITVQVETEQDPPTLILTFLDHGTPFDPLAKEDPDVTLPLRKRRKGGLGIYLTKKTMDEITYEYKDGQNILRMKKRVDKWD